MTSEFLLPPLNNPWMVAAFEGWNDAADAASSVIEHLVSEWDAQVLTELDPEDFYDFQVNRPHAHADEHAHHHDAGATKIFGFWIYLMTDLILFATLFATYAVLSHSFADGPTGKDIFELDYVLGETFLLLFSSITYGFAMLEMQKRRQGATLGWLAITGLLGAAFLSLELYEFANLIHEGAGPWRSAFLSSFFTLVGTHGLHVTFGIIWLITLMVQVGKHGLTAPNRRRLMCLSMFWHFLDVVWIGVFTFVYLMGVLP